MISTFPILIKRLKTPSFNHSSTFWKTGLATEWEISSYKTEHICTLLKNRKLSGQAVWLLCYICTLHFTMNEQQEQRSDHSRIRSMISFVKSFILAAILEKDDLQI